MRASQLPGRFGLHRAAMWIALALLAFQALAVQTHVHAAAPLSRIGLKTIQPNSGFPHAQAKCALCEDMALFGHYTPPAPVAFTLSPTLRFWFQPARATHVAPRVTSHRWRSRAPPSAPQA